MSNTERGCHLEFSGVPALFDDPLPAREDIAALPQVTIQDLVVPPPTVLRPTFDMVWNAFDFEGSINYDSEGNWVGASRG